MKAIKILCFSFFLGLSAVAQQAQTPEQTAQALTQSQTTMLKLTSAQQEQVYTIHLGIAQKNQGILMSNYSEDQKKSIIKSNEEAKMSMLKNILTAEQYAKLEKSVTEQRNH
jgi:Flp pilus assembly protein TadD